MDRKQPETKCATRSSVRSAAKGSPMDSPALSTRERVLRELENLAQGQHPDRQTPLMRFTRCPDWQKAAELILGGATSNRAFSERNAPAGAARLASTGLMPAGCGPSIPWLDGLPADH